ncbi:chemotaxis-specific protein-glutamate methyltransferase CheB [Lachnospira pectinoschiza]|uniref:Protein-glutamate methylesterase/protein-glutamine glutaminase n=1 Tax=Lachnospira pectinoschiza TaxID=28052 RepID=A0A1G9ZC81_9FIRM|nr:chemotaxis-specific protein-glutamate methyltransferase CheB [Lachnospira pectinoschiza]SDN18093.1 two-component system, chemotaxis family, response regulator CheB [Lachnospira pectinoschiza]
MAKKILIIDDSALMRRVISDIINESNEYEVADLARDGLEGFDKIVSNPNLYSAVILDINMPKMNGIELLKKLQQNRIDQTVIVVSTVAKEGAKETIQALEYGAFDFVTKPENYLETKSETFKKKIHEMLDVATNTRASLQRVARGASFSPSSNTNTRDNKDTKVGLSSKDRPTPSFQKSREDNTFKASRVTPSQYSGIKKGKSKLIALACSTGGPKSLQSVIPMLPKNLDAPMVLVQHMPAGFTASLAARLNEMSELNVKEAADGDVITKGNVYIAPGGKHIKVMKEGASYVIRLNEAPAIDGLRPCANVMYDSLQNSNFDEITCVVLTGMGADGTNGIKGLAASHKNIHVIAQDEQSCVVYGMPKALASTGLVNEVVPLNKVAEAITKNVGVS